MSGSVSTLTVAKLDLGPCRVTYAGVDLGATLDKATITFKYDKADMKADQTGSSILDRAISGGMAEVETSIAQIRDPDLIAKVFPHWALITAGAQKANDMVLNIGNRDLALAAALILHPLIEADASLDYDWYFYQAIPTEDSQFVFDPANQQRLKIKWAVLLDLTQTPYKWMRRGDNTI